MQAALAVHRPGLDNDLAVRTGIVETLRMTLHPAKFSKTILERIAAHPLLPKRGWIIDPFAGVGGVHALTTEWRITVGVEIEPEWAEARPGTVVGDSRFLHKIFAGWSLFDAAVTSCTYGNRFSDHHNAKDGSRRRSYTHDLRALTGNPLRMLHPSNTGLFPEGRAYWNLHAEVWTSLRRVLAPGAPVFLNVSNFIRSGVEVDVCGGHLALFSDLGFSLVDSIQVGTPRMRAGQNYQARVAFEQIYVLLNSNPVVR